MATHKILGGKVNLYQRGRSRYWQCSTYLAGSWLSIVEDKAGSIVGKYQTALGSADTFREYELVGWRAGSCVGFTVSWMPKSTSVTAWTGLIEAQPNLTLHTVWTLVRETTINEKENGYVKRQTRPWEAFSVQHSIFEKL